MLIVTLMLLLAAAPADAGLTEAARLAAIYDSILHARFGQASQDLQNACPPAPIEACRTLRVVVLWWQLLIDPDSRALDDRLRREARTAIDAADAWTRREPRRAEAWFYLAGSYAPLVQLQVMRGEQLAAARSGNRIRAALERAIALDPQLQDAYFGIGMYHYYADVMPAAAKLLRMLLLLPGGDREKGLREMLQAREHGVLLSGEADYQLHWFYLWYEQKPAQALQLAQSLDARYPANPVFLQRVAEIHHDYLHDHRASAAAWETLLVRAQKGQVEAPRVADVRARLGLSRELVELSQPERAIELLAPVIAAHAIAPYAAAAIAQLHLGLAYDRLGKRDLAVAAYTAAIALAPDDAPSDIRVRAREGLRNRSRP